jgi:hypothetical protein
MIVNTEHTAIRSPTEFFLAVDKLSSDKRINYLDAVILYCEENSIEIETAATLIKGSSKFKARIQDDAEELNFLPKSRKLPI